MKGARLISVWSTVGGYDAKTVGMEQLSFLLLQVEPVASAQFAIPPTLASPNARRDFNIRCVTKSGKRRFGAVECA